MAYTTPSTWSTGQIVTASQLNEQIRDNMTYVHDAMQTISQTTSSTTKSFNSIYQNTTGKIKFSNIITVHVVICTTGTELDGISELNVYCGTTSPPINPVGKSMLQPIFTGIGPGSTADNQINKESTITFLVPPNYYYTASTTYGGMGHEPYLRFWTEWDILST